MARLRRNFTSGTITDNPLSNSATSINSANFANLPVISSPNTMSLILDPLGTAGAPEIVLVTAHTASSPTVTVSRGQEQSYGGIAGRQHAQGISWVHAVTALEQMVADGFFAAKGTSSATTNIPNGGYTKVTLNTEAYDPNGNFNTSNSDYTAPLTGLYAVSGAVSMSAGTLLNTAVFINSGVVVADGSGHVMDSGQGGIYEFYDELWLTAGDVIDLRVQNLSGSGTAVVGTPANRDLPRFTIRCVSL